MSDSAVDIAKLKRRDQEEWTRVYDLYVETVFSFLYQRIGKRREAAKDLTQQAFLTAFDHIDRYDESYPNFLPWLLGIAKHYGSYLEHEKWEKSEVECPEGAVAAGVEKKMGQLTPREVLMVREESELFEGLLGTLPAQHEKALRLRYLEELPLAEIGRRLNISEKAAEITVRRGRQKLKRSYLELYPFLSASPQKI